MDDITFVTSNDNKLRDAEEALGIKLNRVVLELDELQDFELVNIVEHKARQAYEHIGSTIMVEDVGFYFDAWNGFPGPFIKWMAQKIGFDKISGMVPPDNRGADWVVVYGLFDGKTFTSFEGRVKGSISNTPRGTGSWGFGVFFIPEGQDQTLAELGEGKLQYSARAKALFALKDFIAK